MLLFDNVLCNNLRYTQWHIIIVSWEENISGIPCTAFTKTYVSLPRDCGAVAAVSARWCVITSFPCQELPYFWHLHNKNTKETLKKMEKVHRDTPVLLVVL